MVGEQPGNLTAQAQGEEPESDGDVLASLGGNRLGRLLCGELAARAQHEPNEDEVDSHGASRTLLRWYRPAVNLQAVHGSASGFNLHYPAPRRSRLRY